MWTISSILMILAAYLLGSLSPTFLVARWRRGTDLRHYGSGTVGSSNLGVLLGRAWTVAIGALDWSKGLVPGILARAWGFDASVVVGIGLAAVIGHNWSLYLGFKGGRGIAVTVGALFVWDARLAIAFLIAIGIGWLIKQGAPSCAIAALLLAPAAWLIGDPPEIVLGGGLLMLVIAIKRLEANRLPLPQDPREKRAVLIRRLWLDRDVPRDQPWEERERIM